MAISISINNNSISKHSLCCKLAVHVSHGKAVEYSYACFTMMVKINTAVERDAVAVVHAASISIIVFKSEIEVESEVLLPATTAAVLDLITVREVRLIHVILSNVVVVSLQH